MKLLHSALLVLILAAPFAGCVDVDHETAATPREYWVPTSSAQPSAALTLAPALPGSGGLLPVSGNLDLPALVDIALSNNPQTRQAWYQAKTAAAQLGETNSQYYPQITVGAQATRSKLREVMFNGESFGAGTTYSSSYGPSAEINYVLWNFGKNYAQTDAARQALYAANYLYNQQIQDVILSTQLAYFNFNAGLGFVVAAQATLDDATTSEKAASQRLTTGLGNRQDDAQAKAQVSNAEYQLELAKVQVETARSQLANSLGIPITQDLNIVQNQTLGGLTGLDQEVSSLMATALRQRPTLMAAYANVEAARYNLEAARDDRWPVLSAVASANYAYEYGGTTYGNPFNSYSGGLQLSWDLFSGYNKTYAILSALEQQNAAKEALRTQELKVVTDVWNFFYSYKSALRQVESTNAEVDAQTEAYNAINTGYDNGLNSYVDLLTALNNLATARQQKVQAEANLGASIANLSHATGSLPLDDYKHAK